MTVIPAELFIGCSNLKTVTIPEGITVIGDYAFNGCALTGVTLPSTIRQIGKRAFSNCPLATITIPQTVTSILFTGDKDGGLRSPKLNLASQVALKRVGAGIYTFVVPGTARLLHRPRKRCRKRHRRIRPRRASFIVSRGCFCWGGMYK